MRILRLLAHGVSMKINVPASTQAEYQGGEVAVHVEGDGSGIVAVNNTE